MSGFSDLRFSNISKSEYNENKNIANSNFNPLKRTSPERKSPTENSPRYGPPSKRPTSSPFENRIRSSISYHDGVETVKGTLPDDEVYDETSIRELALAQELDKVVEDLENLREETEYLRAENAQLKEERETIMANYEQHTYNARTGDGNRIDLERKLRNIEGEKARLIEENNKIVLAKMALEAQLGELQNLMENADDQDSKLEVALAERNYFENQLRQARAIQVNLEQEIRQKADERGQMISNYEIKISALQNDIAILQSQKEGDLLKQSQNLVRLQSENNLLLNEINELKNVNKNLEAQIAKLKNENLNVEDSIRMKLAETETMKRNTSNLWEKEKKISDSLRNLLQEKENEFQTKEAEFCQIYEEKLKEVAILEEQNSQKDSKVVNQILLMIEVERLQNLVDERTRELDDIREIREKELEKVKGESETLIHALREELNQLIDSKETDREHRIQSLNNTRGQNSSFNGITRNSQQETTLKSQLPTQGIEFEEEAIENERTKEQAKKSNNIDQVNLEEIKRLKFECENLENSNKALTEKLSEQETKEGLLIAEIERLGTILSQLQDEHESLRQRIQELNDQHSKQAADREKFFELNTKSQLEEETTNLLKTFGKERGDLEAHLHRYQLKINSLEENITVLKTEIMRLQQANVSKGKESNEWRIKHDELARENQVLKENLEGELRKKLTQEISSLNSKWAKDRLEYENQISQAKMSISELENKKLLLINENERLLKVIKERDLDIENWRERVVELENEHQGHIDKFKQQLEASMTDRIEREVANRSIQLESEKGILEKNLQNMKTRLSTYEDQISNLNRDILILRQELAEKTKKCDELTVKALLLVESEKEIDSWKIKYNQLQKKKDQEIKDLNSSYLRLQEERAIVEQRLDNTLVQKKSLEDKLFALNNEIAHLKQLNNKSRDENTNLNKRIKGLENDISTHKVQYELDLKKVSEIKEKEKNELSSRFSKEKSEFEDVVSKLKANIQDFELRIVLFLIEIERLHGIIIEKEKEIESWKERIFEQEANHNSTIDELRKQFEIMLQNRIEVELGEAEERFQAEKEPLELEIIGLKGQIQKQDETLNAFASDNQALGEEIDKRNSDIEHLHQRINQIQIENEQASDRLRQNVQNKLKTESENQMKELTLKFSNERTALESQMRQMKNRITEMENQLQISQDENEKLAGDLQVKYGEIEEMKRQYIELEKNSAVCMNELADRLNKQREIEISDTVNRLETQHQGEIDSLSTQIRGLENQIKGLKNKVEEYEENIVVLSNEVENQNHYNIQKTHELEETQRNYETRLINLQNDLESQARATQETMVKEHEIQANKLRQAITEYETNLNLMVDEVERLTALADNKEQELALLGNQMMETERQKERELEDIRRWAEKDKKIAVEKEAKEFMNKLTNEKTVFEGKIKEANSKLGELQKTITLLTTEIDRITSLYGEKEREIASWREKYHDLDQTRLSEIEEIRIQFETLKRNSLSAGDYEVRLQAERAAYSTQMMQLKQKIGELETDIADLTKDNERVNILYLQKKKEVEILKASHGELESGVNAELTQLRKENEQLRKSIAEARENLESEGFDKRAYESQISQLKQSLELHKIEIAKLHDIINTKKSENEILQIELNNTRGDIERNGKAYKELESEYLKLVSSYENLYREVGDLKHSRDLYKIQSEQNNTEIAKKNRELMEKLQQMDILKAKYEEAITNVEPIKATTKTITKTTLKKYDQ